MRGAASGGASPGAGSRAGGRFAGAGRVIAGSARGIRLVAPVEGVRPMGDRLKQALFAMLEPELRGQTFLDLFAGTGAGGIEALSRGAAAATFVDSDAAAVRSIERNLVASHLATSSPGESHATVVRADAIAWLKARHAGPYHVALLDPPYEQPELLTAALRALAGPGPGGLVDLDGLVVAKHAVRASPPARIGLLGSARERRFGESALTFYRWSDGEAG